MVLGRSPGSLHPIQRVALHRHHASRNANGKDMVWRSICQLAVQFFLVITAAKIPANFCLAAARGFTQGRRGAWERVVETIGRTGFSQSIDASLFILQNFFQQQIFSGLGFSFDEV